MRANRLIDGEIPSGSPPSISLFSIDDRIDYRTHYTSLRVPDRDNTATICQIVASPTIA